MEPQDLLEQHRNGLHILHEAHFVAAKHYERLGRLLGCLVVFLSATAGTAIFQSFSESPNGWLRWIATGASLGATTLAAVQTFLAYPALAERHRAAAHKYGSLRRAVERMLSYRNTDESAVTEVQEKWDDLDEQSPSVPSRIINRAPQRIADRSAQIRAHRPQ
ncbi:SLATT domain-containing protein [Streptomyces mirabilis]|uniref:SLATT domain-containing protein n=1 Tax=Streptomyces mirabilis TaxID=68239 RepID=UPI0033A716E3